MPSEQVWLSEFPENRDQRMKAGRKNSLSVSPNGATAGAQRKRSTSSCYIRSKSPRQFDNINEDGEGIQVSPIAKVIWFAKQGVWTALDALLDKLLLEDKSELKFDQELLPV